jgi:flavin-dependent dehydrogenase
MLDYKIIIVGAGPSGSAAALKLANLDASLSPQILLLDKAVFPRPKLCAGGVTNNADRVLRQLRADFESPSVAIHTSSFLLPAGSLNCHQPSQFRIVRRTEFDDHLFRTARKRGIVTQEGEVLEEINWTSSNVIVGTSKERYRAKILIGADGANSTVRRLVKQPRQKRLMMALEILVPKTEVLSTGLCDNTAFFDFSLSGQNLPGYFWIFPGPYEDPPVFSMGVMVTPFQNSDFGSLSSLFARWLWNRGVDLKRFDLQAHPALRYESRASYSQEGILFAGDAVGIDPLFGEGITSALAIGTIAAHSALDAIRKDDFSFADYGNRIRSSFVGTLMRRRCILARKLYTKPRVNLDDRQYATLLDWVAPTHFGDKPATITWRSVFPRVAV